MSPIYFDHNSTTEMCAPAIEIIMKELLHQKSIPLNPSSQHSYGRLANKKLTQARRSIAEVLNVNLASHDIIFTSCGTESNHIIINHCKQNQIFFLSSEVEHASIYENSDIKIPITEDGIVSPDCLENMLKQYSFKDFINYSAISDLKQDFKNSNQNLKNDNNLKEKILVSIMFANNEIGTINDIKELTNICKKYNALIHTDCSQIIGKIDFDFDSLGVDFATISSHKLGGPHGISALIAKKRTIISSLKGGKQEFSARPGSENVIGAVAFAVAVQYANQNLKKYQDHTSVLRNYLEKQLQDYAIFVCQNTNRLPNTSMILPLFEDDLIYQRLDLAGFCISNGSACSSGNVIQSYVLSNIFKCVASKRQLHNDQYGNQDNMNMKNKWYKKQARSYSFALNDNIQGIRVSFGLANTKEEVDFFIEKWKQIAKLKSEI